MPGCARPAAESCWLFLLLRFHRLNIGHIANNACDSHSLPEDLLAFDDKQHSSILWRLHHHLAIGNGHGSRS